MYLVGVDWRKYFERYDGLNSGSCDMKETARCHYHLCNSLLLSPNCILPIALCFSLCVTASLGLPYIREAHGCKIQLMLMDEN